MGNLGGIIVSVLGWIGALATFSAYYLVSAKKLAPDSLKYHALNMGGASLLAIMCVYAGAWPSVVSNTIFVLIGINVILTTKRHYIVYKIMKKKSIKNKRPLKCNINENTTDMLVRQNISEYLNTK